MNQDENNSVEIDIGVLTKVQFAALGEIARIVHPWMEVSDKPISLKIKNETVGSSHVVIAIEEGDIIITLKTRVKAPSPEVLIIPTDEERVIDLTAR